MPLLILFLILTQIRKKLLCTTYSQIIIKRMVINKTEFMDFDVMLMLLKSKVIKSNFYFLTVFDSGLPNENISNKIVPINYTNS